MRDWRGKNLDEKPSRSKDMEALRKLLDAHVGELSASETEAFASMQNGLVTERYVMLTERQRAWVMEALDRFEGEGYENLVSRGLVSSKTSVATLPCLMRDKLPKRPPRRKGNDDGQ